MEPYIPDRRGEITTKLRGWQHLSELESEGSYEDIKRNLGRILERKYHAGEISPEAYEQPWKSAKRFPSMNGTREQWPA